MKKIMVALLMLILSISIVSASGVTTDRLNWFESEQHTLTITNTEGGVSNAVSTMPTGFSFVSSVSGCTNPSGQTVTCNSIADSGTALFIMSSPSSGTEYELSVLNTTVGATTVNNVSFLNIRSDEIFHTLIEYGRGRGNYFYDSMGTATSAGTGTGYPYVPNGTAFELNYLHKIYNIKQYYGLANNADATDISFVCVYPYHTVVRQHLTDSISNDGTDWTVSYALPKIEGSWERMGFLGQDVDAGEYSVGDNMTINCTSLNYSLDDAYGNIVVDEDSFSLQIRDPEPVSVVASADPSTIGNGTSEVEITYTITNNELYPLDGIVIEVDAPPLAQFIGVRGELWGSAQDKYRYELTEMDAGQIEEIVLVARFDTSASSDTSLELTQGIKAKFVPSWELNAYNPMQYIQDLAPATTLTVNYGVSSSINSIQTQLDNLETTLSTMNTTINTINSTVNNIETLSNAINITTNEINSKIDGINLTQQQILSMVTNINNSMLTLETADGDILIAINNSRDTILSAINSTEGTIIANLTQYILDSLGNISLDTTEIMTELSYMQGFNEELIFLVTDSVGLADDAKSEFEVGNYEVATKMLDEASENMEIVKMEIDDYKAPLKNKYQMQNEKNIFKKATLWIKGLFL